MLSTLAARSASATIESPQGQTSKSIWLIFEGIGKCETKISKLMALGSVFLRSLERHTILIKILHDSKANFCCHWNVTSLYVTCLAHSKLKAPDVPSLAILLILYLFHQGLSSIPSVAKRTKNSSLSIPKCRSQGGIHSAFPSLSSSIFSVRQTQINVIDA